MQDQVSQALLQVRQLRARVIEGKIFQGYSGKARILGGVVAILGCLVMSLPFYPASVKAHVVGWGVVCIVAAAFNYLSLFAWYRRLPEEDREILQLKPAIDALPVFTVGGILTLVCLQVGQAGMLFGVWMLIFGLVNTASRSQLPSALWWLGWYYIVCGIYYLLVFSVRDFLQPWPMGIVFAVGEVCGGVILHKRTNLSNSQLKDSEFKGVV